MNFKFQNPSHVVGPFQGSMEGLWQFSILCPIKFIEVGYFRRLFFFFFCLFAFSRAAPVAYGDSQARGLIGSV